MRSGATPHVRNVTGHHEPRRSQSRSVSSQAASAGPVWGVEANVPADPQASPSPRAAYLQRRRHRAAPRASSSSAQKNNQLLFHGPSLRSAPSSPSTAIRFQVIGVAGKSRTRQQQQRQSEDLHPHHVHAMDSTSRSSGRIIPRDSHQHHPVPAAHTRRHQRDRQGRSPQDTSPPATSFDPSDPEAFRRVGHHQVLPHRRRHLHRHGRLPRRRRHRHPRSRRRRHHQHHARHRDRAHAKRSASAKRSALPTAASSSQFFLEGLMLTGLSGVFGIVAATAFMLLPRPAHGQQRHGLRSPAPRPLVRRHGPRNPQPSAASWPRIYPASRAAMPPTRRGPPKGIAAYVIQHAPRHLRTSLRSHAASTAAAPPSPSSAWPGASPPSSSCSPMAPALAAPSKPSSPSSAPT